LRDASKAPENLPRSALKQQIREQYTTRAQIEDELGNICTVASLASDTNVKWKALSSYLQRHHPLHYALLLTPPEEVAISWDHHLQDGWQVIGQQQRPAPRDAPFDWWRQGWDLDLLTGSQQEYERQVSLPSPTLASTSGNRFAALLQIDDSMPSFVRDLFTTREVIDVGDVYHPASPGLSPPIVNCAWQAPRTNRPLVDLLESPDIWAFSEVERRAVVAHWVQSILSREVPKLAALRRAHHAVSDRINTLHDQTKLAVLRQAKVVGCTTNG
jgi:hypothetical protein